MIKLYFPEGCYGSYVARCIYNFTNLRTTCFEDFSFDSYGSSHKFWSQRSTIYSVLQYGHINAQHGEFDNTVGRNIVILPDHNHILDYFMNQFYKRFRNKFWPFVFTHLSEQEIIAKFKSDWHYNGTFADMPRWMKREWCSFWLIDFMNKVWNIKPYLEIDYVTRFNAQDIVSNWLEVFYQLVEHFELQVTVPFDLIKTQHKKFLCNQNFVGIQLNCQNYVNNTLNGIDQPIHVHNIFDESYLQYLLRQQGFELNCDKLEVFPTSTQQLRSLLYAP